MDTISKAPFENKCRHSQLRMDKDAKNTMGRIWDQRRVLRENEEQKSLKTRKR